MVETPTPPTPFPPAGSGTDDAAGRLEDSFLLAGLFGTEDVDTLLEDLRGTRSTLLEEKEARNAAEIDLLKTQISDLENGQEAAAEESRSLTEEMRTINTRVTDVLPGFRRLLERHSAGIKELLAKRSYYPVRLISKRLDEYTGLSTQLAEQLLPEEQQLLEQERTLYKAELERRGWNQKENDRKEKFLERQLARAEEGLQQAETSVTNLRLLGLTRKTSGFLVWAGYLSFAGFGWFAGESIKTLAGNEPGILQTVFLLLAGGLKALIERFGMVLGASVLLLAPLVLMLILFLVFYLTDKFLHFFVSRGSAWGDRSGRGRGASQQPMLTSFQNPVRNVGREDYVQILAKLPILYLWAILPAVVVTILFGLGGSAVTVVDLSTLLVDPIQSFTYTFLGLVLCVVIAAILMLYAVLVIGPRHRRYMEDGVLTGRDAFRMNAELGTFLAILIVLVIAPDMLRTAFPGIPSIWQRGASAGIWLLPFLGGFAVSYGLIYKGIFSDYNAAKREVQERHNELQEQSTFPLGRGRVDSATLLRSRLDELRKEIDKKWEQVELWGKPRLRFRLPRFRWLRPKGLPSPPGEEVAQGAFSLVLADLLLEPELVQEINSIAAELAETRQALDDLRGRNREILDRLTEIKAANLEERLASCHRQIAEARARHWRERVEMVTSQNDLVARCKNAFQVGTFLREDPQVPGLKIASRNTA